MRSLPALSLSLAATLAPATLAQSTVQDLPRIYSNTEGNDLLSYPFGFTAFRMQQIWDAQSIAPNQAAITGIAYRPDNDNSIGSKAVSFPNVKVEMSQTALSPATMNTLFAQNVTGMPVTVFQGSLNLPAYTSAPGQIAPFSGHVPLQTPFVMQTAAGDLLIDMTVTDPSPAVRTDWIADAALPGGSTSGFGTAGQNSTADFVNLLVSGNGTAGRFSGIVPGNQINLIVESQWNQHSGELMLGFQKLATPFDLTPFGAAGNSIYTLPDVSLPFTLQPTFFSYRSTFPLNLPNNPALVGGKLYGQPWIFDAAANPLGIVMSSAREITVGEPTHPVEQLHTNDPANPAGSKAYGTSSIPGGAIVRLLGQFN